MPLSNIPMGDSDRVFKILKKLQRKYNFGSGTLLPKKIKDPTARNGVLWLSNELTYALSESLARTTSRSSRCLQ